MKKYLTFPIIIRLGLACVFLANGITAFTEPSEFLELVGGSFVAGLLPVSVATFVTFVGFHDTVMAILLASGWQSRWVSRWASIWLVGVILVVGVISLEALEHLSFLAMALSLAL